MPVSNYVFDRGDGIYVGSHGDSEYVFAQDEPVPNVGGSQFLFESGVGIGGTREIDFFNDTDLSEYNDTGNANSITSEAVSETALKIDSVNNDDTGNMRSDSGLPNYPAPGDRFQYYFKLKTNNSSSHGFHWAQGTGGELRTHPSGELQALEIMDSTGGIERTPVEWSNYIDQWLRIEIYWTVDNGESTVELWLYNLDNDLIAYVSATTSDTTEQGGIKFSTSTDDGGDIYLFDEVGIIS